MNARVTHLPITPSADQPDPQQTLESLLAEAQQYRADIADATSALAAVLEHLTTLTATRFATTPDGHTTSPLLTFEEAADYLKVSRTTLWRLTSGQTPALPIVRVGGTRRLRRADLDTYLGLRS